MDDIFAQLAPGLYVRNETMLPILVVLSQLTPLHWIKVEANSTIHISCGRVFFTVSTEFFDERKVPSQRSVALRIAAITLSTVFTGFYAGAFFGIGVVGGVSALTSQKKCKVDGVLADGKTVVIAGTMHGIENNVYELFIHSIEMAGTPLRTNDEQDICLDDEKINNVPIAVAI